MASIGGITVDIVRGLPQPLKTRLDVWETPGIDGYGALRLGEGDAQFDCQTVNYVADLATAEARKTSLCGLQGSVVTLVDNWAHSFTKILVQHVDVAFQPCRWNGNAAAVRVQAQWRLCQA